MEDQERKKPDLHNTRNKICCQETSPMIKCVSIIIKKNHRVNGAMNDQKNYQERTRKPHDNFFAYRRSVIFQILEITSWITKIEFIVNIANLLLLK